MSRTLAACLVALAIGSTACTATYKSFFKKTNSELQPKPLRPDQVRVVASRDELSSEWTELGVYRGQAPTVDEATQKARQGCGENGASLFIHNTEPFESEGVYKVDGICAVE